MKPVIVCVCQRYGTSTFNYFSEQGIAGPKPIPYVGNMWGMWREVYDFKNCLNFGIQQKYNN